jgi:AraC-like DNA-binding protein
MSKLINVQTLKSSNDSKTLGDNLGQASVPAVNQYLQLAKDQHIDISEICNAVGLSQAILTDNSQHITGLQFQQLITTLLTATKDELFGLHTAKYVQPGSYSVLGYISMNCENLGQAITKIQPFEKLVGDMGTTTFEDLGEQVKISWHCQFPDANVKRHMIDNCLASWLTFARYLVSKESNPTKVLLARKPPDLDQQTQYQAVFKCPITYGQNENSIIFSRALLSLPLNKGDQQLLTTLESHASELISNLDQEENFVEQLSNIITSSLKIGKFHQQDIAALFGISSKTMQRRLASFGVSFQTILDQSRLAIAKQLLTDSSMNLDLISAELGFTEPRSFYRWFNKLTEQTPGDFRKKTTN